MSEQNVALTFNILKENSDGPIIFTETHNTQTNAFGLVNLQIGSISSLSDIDWSSDSYFAEIFVNGTRMGSTQLLSVPYALHARSAIESDPVFESSSSAGIEAADVDNWNAAHSWGNHAEEDYIKIEAQTLSDVAALGNSVNTQLKNVLNPIDEQDAATKAYVDDVLPEVFYSPWINFTTNGWSNSVVYFGQTRREYQVQVPQINTAFLSEGSVMVFVRLGGTSTKIQPLPLLGPVLSSSRDQVLNYRIEAGLIVLEFHNLTDRNLDPGIFAGSNQFRYVLIPGTTSVQN